MLLCFIVDGHLKNQTEFPVQHDNATIQWQSPLKTTGKPATEDVKTNSSLQHGKNTGKILIR